MTQQKPTLDGWRVKYADKINPDDNDFYGNEDCGCLSADQIDEIVTTAKEEERQRILEALPDTKEGFEMEPGVMFAEIPPELLKDMEQFRFGYNICRNEVLKIINP